MMDGIRLTDRMAYGAGFTARQLGQVCDAYRPRGVTTPLRAENRFIRLHVALLPPSGALTSPAPVGTLIRRAWVDWSYLAAGDYLVWADGKALVLSIEPPAPVLVTLVNATISIGRVQNLEAPGLNAYSALLPQDTVNLLEMFPVSMVAFGSGYRPNEGLPDDTKPRNFAILLPRIEDVGLQVADIVSNDRGESFSITSVEEFPGYLRLSCTQVVN